MDLSTWAIWATVIGSALATAIAGLGLGVLVGILGTIGVVVLAWHEQEALRQQAMRREALREAARRDG